VSSDLVPSVLTCGSYSVCATRLCIVGRIPNLSRSKAELYVVDENIQQCSLRTFELVFLVFLMFCLIFHSLSYAKASFFKALSTQKQQA
jgi:hypothetical protein